MSNFIKEISTRALFNHKIDTVKKILDTSELNDESKQDILEKTFKDKDKIEIMEKQIPFWELAYGLSFLCGVIAFEKNKITILTKDINTLSSLLKQNVTLTSDN